MNAIDPHGPPPRKGLAVTSLFLGLASYLLLLGPLTGIPAIITGHVALRRTRRDPANHAGAGKAIAGLVLGYVSLLLGLPLLALVLTLVMPQFLRMRDQAREFHCTENLKKLAAATHEFAANHEHRYPTNVLQLAGSLPNPTTLHCPSDSLRKMIHGTDGSAVTADQVSYDLLRGGDDAQESKGSPVLRCPLHGTVVMDDGSTQPGRIGAKRKKREQ